MIKYIVTFQDDSQYLLFGADYYHDKKVFWETHLNNLNTFCEVMKNKGIPIAVRDIKEGVSWEIKDASAFKQWYITHQSYKWCFPDN